MSEQQGGPNVFGSVIRNPHSEDSKYMQWGVHHSNLNPDPHAYSRRAYPLSRESDEDGNRGGSGEEGWAGRRYLIQNSQVSAIETGFKKLKSNQIQILKELKKEYDVLRNSSLDSRVNLHKKNTSESESLLDSASQSDAQSNFSKQTHTRQKRTDSKELQMVTLEKKQLELMLNNSMKKIEELLHQEIELKKSVLELKSKLESNKMTELESDATLKKSKENESALQRHLEELRRENESLKMKVKELILSMGNLEGAVNVKEVQLRKKEEKIKMLEEEKHLQRNKLASLELDVKKLRMEYEVLEKSKNEEISLLLRNRQNIEELAASQKNVAVRKLKEELEVKEQRYLILLNQLNKEPITRDLSRPEAASQEKQSNRNIERLIQTLKEEKSQQNSETIGLIMNKLSELQQQQRPDHSLVLEINNLRHELDLVKQSTVSQTDHRKEAKENITQYEIKIRELEKVIQEENIEKIYFMEDLKKLTRDYSSLKREKEELLREARELKDIIDRLETENRRFRGELDMIKNVNVDLTESQHQNKNLMVKLQHMNLREIEINNVREEYTKRIDQFKLREHTYEEELRLTKRQLHEEEFKVFKEHEENQLKLKLLRIEHQNEVSRLQEELQRTKKSYALQKNDLLNDKIQLEKKLLEKAKELEDHSEKVTIHLKDKDSSVQKLKSEQELLMKRQQQLYASEINALVARIQSLSSSNEHLLQQSHRYALIEQEMAQLKKHMRMNRKLTETVDHLWQVKETEYSNIHDILTTLK